MSHDATPASGDMYRELASLGDSTMPPLLNPSAHPAASETHVRTRRDVKAPVITLHDGLNVVSGDTSTVDAGALTFPYAMLRLDGGEARLINPKEMIIDMGAGATRDTVNVGRSGNDLVVTVSGAKQTLVVPGLYGMEPQPILTLRAGGLRYYVAEDDTIEKLGKALGNPGYQPSEEVREFLKSKWHG
ncbi:hypothetical protein [Bordetella sp. LUAb4]|uniref:hypothetical protein n=1 Tax=Bordetella sp. LUAb4 TaxID=2843195 RepID=UPI001E63378F|nr:hypothetical protein [Bordetella sp. LUAb4]